MREVEDLTDEFYMQRALRLARRGERWVSPNPMVGAVIVKDDRIIGEGYHRQFGGPHAEINALQHTKEPVRDATIYVTLEPCSHYGKTPPCIEALIERRPARVVIGTADPNPLVAGRGIAALRQTGIDVTAGVMEQACREINERFFKFITTGIPFVTLKFAQTVDGRIASVTGHSRWISSPSSRAFAHRLRSTHDAILVGAGTVMADDPELTVRHVRGRNPIRIVVDSHLRLPFTAKILTSQSSARTIIATTGQAAPEKMRQLQEQGIETLLADEFIGADGSRRVDLRKLLREIGKRQIASVLVEGGSAIITSLLQEKLADRLVIIVAPKILGRGIEAVADLGNKSIDEATRIFFRKVYRRSGDIIIDAIPVN
ncbi:MAG: bifunctional diaminohydroxyphosphoribosylaminopyrimidine deaminase/5-amino-6-(5-phosphoribosylamino)uracil reductase RibD [Syntrophales bacterium LBB04]|nr:bifunctional diaminohydroxyphosphoribosylaminopyrimidine deaminase/5-amino-6-(5-phosphoribosylamino)uracil reductase RibD [Syntrophales bacterium LBB04]